MTSIRRHILDLDRGGLLAGSGMGWSIPTATYYGHVLLREIHPAQDRDDAVPLLQVSRPAYPSIQSAFAYAVDRVDAATPIAIEILQVIIMLAHH